MVNSVSAGSEREFVCREFSCTYDSRRFVAERILDDRPGNAKQVCQSGVVSFQASEYAPWFQDP
jgi:hypothetical protein